MIILVHMMQVHSSLSEEQKIKVCLGLNYEKLSSEAFNHLSKNTKFPSKSAINALVSQQRKLKGLLLDSADQATFTGSPWQETKEEEGSEQVVLYAKRLNLSDENAKLKAHLQGMQCRVVELESVCRKMQVQMSKMMKSRIPRQGNAKSVPRLCS